MSEKRKIYLTVTGTRYRYGQDIFSVGQRLRLVKEPGNTHDREAIRVEAEGLGLVGYVANSVNTRLGESWSAGRIYDKMGGTAVCRVVYILKEGVVCSLKVEA